MATALEMLKPSSTCSVAVSNGRGAETTTYEELYFNVEQRVSLANKEMPRLEVEVVKMIQKRDARVRGLSSWRLEYRAFPR